MDKKETNRLRQQRYREKQKALRNGVTKSVTIPPESVTKRNGSVTEVKENVTPNNIHPIVHILADIGKRAKLRAICESLKPWAYELIFVGVPGKNGIPFSHVNELLTAFDD